MEELIFQGSTLDFNRATEEGVMLRRLENRKRDWSLFIVLAVLIVLGGLYLTVTEGELVGLGLFTLLAVLMLYTQYTGERNARQYSADVSKLYKGSVGLSAEKDRMPMKVVFSGDFCTYFQNYKQLSQVNCRKLMRVVENEQVYRLHLNRRTAIMLPKACLQKGQEEVFRAYLTQHLSGKPIETCPTPEWARAALTLAQQKTDIYLKRK